jgi:phosphopantetheinyl transferase (holo-ACP synthase)
LEAVSISDIARDKEAVLEAYFSRREREKIKNGRVATIGGNLAVKRAAKKVLSASGFSGLVEKTIEIGRGKNGAPEVIFHRDDILDEKVRVSISHTKDTAYGLAVYETGKDD